MRSELTFFVSVRVPHSAAPIALSDVFTSQRSEPCSMRTSETPSARSSLAQLGHVGPRDLRRERARARHRLRDDLDERDAGPVVVDERMRRAVDAAGRAADVQRLAGVLLEVHALDADPHGFALDLDVEVSLDAQRLVVLRDLEVLRHVGVEVVLAGEPAPRRDVQFSARPIRIVDSIAAALATGSAPGRPRQTGQMCVFGSAPNVGRATTEHLRAVPSST